MGGSVFIGEAAIKSGASQRAIRLYESLGLLQVLREGKYRIYSDSDIEFIKLIKEAQSLGLQLSEMKQLKAEKYDFDWQRVSELLNKKQAEADADIKKLTLHKLRLKQYQQSIDTCLQMLDSAP
tara:strand:+ start:11980 stop:12351 length:372 start_codon:yes stop_codon:yes gene_type:complete